MCGFVGWSLRPGVRRPLAELRAMRDRIAHRGPDDCGELTLADQGVAFAHARLSIIDLSTAGRQPMVSAAGRHALAYNGELYNFRRLRAELEAQGHTFHSRTDSEVVLRALEAWGAAALERFCGMFAFAAWSGDGSRVL